MIQKDSIHKSNYSVSPITSFGCMGYDSLGAIEDIKNGTPFILTVSDIVPTMFSDEDHHFENDYKVIYKDLGGALQMSYSDCIVKYNKVIIRHLDDKFGKKWRRFAHKNVCALNN